MNYVLPVAAAFIAVVVVYVGRASLARQQRLRQAEFIRAYRYPPGLLDKLEHKYSHFRRKQTALVGQALRQFFLAYLQGGREYVAMPSQVVDDLWHEFILYTREYDQFCKKAFGRFLHHTPAVALSPEMKSSNEGLRRIWWQCCRQENIDPVRPTRLPLLFALDSKFKIPNGYIYQPNCDALRRKGNAGAQCGADFATSSVDGSTSGFGDSGSGGGYSDANDSGSAGSYGGGDSGGGSCGGGCGGGD